MTLTERIAKCSRDDDPSAPPRKPEPPLWVRRALAKKLPAKVYA